MLEVNFPIVLGLFDEPLAEEDLGHTLKGFVLALEEVDFVLQTAQHLARWPLVRPKEDILNSNSFTRLGEVA